MILFANYTGSSYHWGCFATSQAIYDRLSAIDFVQSIGVTAFHQTKTPALSEVEAYGRSNAYLKDNAKIAEKLTQATHVVINGEGTLHGSKSVGARGLLAFIAASKAMGKPVSLINHSVFPSDFEHCPDADAIYAAILSGLDFIAARDSQSVAFYARHNIPCVAAFDCLPLYVADIGLETLSVSEDGPIVVAGAVNFSDEVVRGLCKAVVAHANNRKVVFLIGSPGRNAHEDDRFARIAQDIRGIEVQDTPSFSAFMKTLMGASLLVSGRFHYNVAALCAQIPLITFDSNTPKNTAMLRDVGYRSDILSHTPFDVNGLINALQAPKANNVAQDNQKSLAAKAARNFDFLKHIELNKAVASETLGQKLLRLFGNDIWTEVVATYEAASGNALPDYIKIAVAKSYRAIKQPLNGAKICGLVLDTAPDNISAHANLITCYDEAGEYAAAQEAFSNATAHYPSEFAIWVPAAICALNAGDDINAIARFEHITKLKPDYLPARIRLVSLYRDRLQNHAKAHVHAQAAVNLSPEDPTLQRVLGEGLLALGQYEAGFEAYRSRLQTPAFLQSTDNRFQHLPTWNGEALEGPLLVLTEAVQGVGFELLCASLIPHLRKRGIDVVCEASEKLISMLRHSYDATFYPLDVTQEPELPNCAAKAHFTDLCELLGQDVTNAPLPNIKVVRPKRIGISWNAENRTTGKGRSFDLSDWSDIIRGTPGATWVNLQYGDVQEEIAEFEAQTGLSIEHVSLDYRHDNAGLVEAIESVDLVISVDNSTVFYANALQKPVIAMPPIAAHWIWGVTGSRTPWLPYAEVFRRTPGTSGQDILRSVAWYINTHQNA